jgi:hypothetical protein
MQSIEKDALNVRSAVYHLRREDGSLEFILFPMIHVGAKEFYGEVSRRLAACDLVLKEGVDSTKRVNLLTRSYRIVKKIERMDLMTQQEGMKGSRFGEETVSTGEVVNTDIEGEAFDERWPALAELESAALLLDPDLRDLSTSLWDEAHARQESRNRRIYPLPRRFFRWSCGYRSGTSRLLKTPLPVHLVETR